MMSDIAYTGPSVRGRQIIAIIADTRLPISVMVRGDYAGGWLSDDRVGIVARIYCTHIRNDICNFLHFLSVIIETYQCLSGMFTESTRKAEEPLTLSDLIDHSGFNDQFQ